MLCIQVAIVENEEPYRKQPEELLHMWEQEKQKCELLIQCFTKGEDFLKEDVANFHIIFMDIELDGEISGIKTAHILKKRGSRIPLAFLTMHEIYVYDGYDTNAMAFILKPVQYERIRTCMDNALERMSDAKYIFNSKDTILSIPYRDILYCQAALHYTTLVTVSETITHKIPFYEILGQLPRQFVRCHRTTSVNVMHIKQIKGRELLVSNSTWLTISKPYLNQVRETYMDWISF